MTGTMYDQVAVRGAWATVVLVCAGGCVPPLGPGPVPPAPTARDLSELRFDDLDWPKQPARLAEPVHAGVATWLRALARPERGSAAEQRPALGPDDADLIPALVAAVRLGGAAREPPKAEFALDGRVMRRVPA